MRFLVPAFLLSSLLSQVVGQGSQLATPHSRTATPPNVPAQAIPANASHEVPNTYKGRVLTVGSGGELRGQETAYSLLDDGRLFRQKPGRSTYTFIGKQTEANTAKVFWSVEERAAIKKAAYNKPGNVYRFVRWKKGREQYHVAWAPDAKDVPPYYEQVYTAFVGMIPPTSR